jgi:Na+-driven multidrug efflux pump
MHGERRTDGENKTESECEMKKSNTYLYEEMPVSRAIFTLVIPTVISQLITVLYNMADTFFIGQMNDPHQVAAATLAMPLFVMMTGFANLFGIGGASLISRSLGAGDREKARKCANIAGNTGVRQHVLDTSRATDAPYTAEATEGNGGFG